MEKHFNWLLGRARGFAAKSTTILRQGLWLMLFLLGWVSTAQAAIPASERQVLLDLYASTNGAGWITNTGWNGAVGTECTWYGVACDGMQSHVVKIYLDGNHLVGTLPPLSELTALQYFYAYNNQLTGSIPSLSGLTALQEFAVDFNQLSGSIPLLSGLTALQTFIAWNNQLTGSIPPLDGLAALQRFDVSGNQLTGPIPSLSGLTALRQFWVGANQLTGSIPSLNGLTALQTIVVGGNQLTGPIPPAPSSLLAGQSSLCGNSLASSGNAAIDTAWMTAQTTDTSMGGVAAGNWLACQISGWLAVTRAGGSGTGTVTSTPAGIDCGTTCGGIFPSGTSVSLTATPASGSYFARWGGACTGTGSCVVTTDAAKNIIVIATFKPVPFVANATSIITPTSATITTTVAFNTPDVGKQGAVYVTAWVPANGLGALGLLTATLNHAMSVTITRDNPHLGGGVNSRQEALGTLLAATDPTTFVLAQRTPSGWALVVNGQLIPYASGVLGDALSSLNILNNADPANLLGAQFCVGYGTSDTEMILSGRMLPVAIIPDANGNAATSGSCNVADIVVEFYNTNLDHYFITADASEAAQIDNGSAGPGWSRTGNSFRSGGSTSVCRFYGSQSPGPNSHFYTVDASECAGLQLLQASTPDTEKRWNFESMDFVSTPASNGACPAGTTPVYRAYNNGFARGIDSNHRITSSATAIQEVVLRGWNDEGVVMCAPN